MTFIFKMAVQRLVILFFYAILCVNGVNVSALNALSQGYLSRLVACKTYHKSKMDCSHRKLVDIPVLDRNLTTMLDLSHNQLKEVHGTTFTNLTGLLHLDLSHNTILLLNPGAFKGLGNLQELDLSHNKLKALPREIFSDQSKLVYLEIRGNALCNIPSQTLTTLYSLQHLYLTYKGSAFDILMRSLKSLTKLEDLRILGLETNITNATVHPLTGLPIQTLQLIWTPFVADYWIEKNCI